MRDNLNTEENYKNLILKKEGFIKEDIAEYMYNTDWDSDRIQSQFSTLFMYSYQVLISKYSLGLEVADLRNDFESGALVKILKMDDKNLKDVNYYPFDLVHYK